MKVTLTPAEQLTPEKSLGQIAFEEHHKQRPSKQTNWAMVAAAVEAAVLQRAALTAARPAALPVPVDYYDLVNKLLNHIEDVLDDEAWESIDIKQWNAVTSHLKATQPAALPAPAREVTDADVQAACEEFRRGNSWEQSDKSNLRRTLENYEAAKSGLLAAAGSKT